MSSPQRLSFVVWPVAIASALAWLAIASLYDRYSTHTRYSGMGIIAVVWFGAVPLAALVLAVGHAFIASARVPLGYASIACGAFVVVIFFIIVVKGEARLAQRRAAEQRDEQQRAALDAEIDGMSLSELVTVSRSEDLARSGLASTIGLRRLSEQTRCSDAAQRAELCTAMTAFVARADLVLSVAFDIVKHSCEAFRPALMDAFLVGVLTREDRDTAFTITQLFDLDQSGALIERITQAKAFSPQTQTAAVLEEIAKRTPEGIRRASRLIAIGVSPAAGNPPLSQLMKEIAQERNERWPEGAHGEDVELYYTILAAEGTRR